jgi:hypothetical protein
MDDHHTVIEIRRPVEFSIDGRTYQTLVRWQLAQDLLLLAGRDPWVYHLIELRGYGLRPVTFASGEMVGIHRRARFVAIRDRAYAV